MLSARTRFSRRLLNWYGGARRDLPWRICIGFNSRPQAYSVLVSELMLQQTQVATVIPYYLRFMSQFPSLAHLAEADEQEVLRLWQGLGYYSRARNLHSTARIVMRDFAGQLPGDVEELLKLPGIGRYTAGAIASIAFGKRVPILDGNVQRVLCRLDNVQTDPRDRATQQLLWKRAEEILPKKEVGDFNSALMELGAMICTPRNPLCPVCPVREHCLALAAGTQQAIPAPRKSRPTPLVLRKTYCIRRGDRWLIEQRPAKGRWAGLWQFVTVAHADAPLAQTTPPKPLGIVNHSLTHRRYQFEVFFCEMKKEITPVAGLPRRWTTLDALSDFPLPRPHLKIAQMLRESVLV